ncbi:hypothetical protein BY996DRAFT_8549226 [Phakopsora pachyrhizi]|nr:hypothetical protein BY996DRAFT_8549226 [Phakopsora pachyrhizi]
MLNVGLSYSGYRTYVRKRYKMLLQKETECLIVTYYNICSANIVDETMSDESDEPLHSSDSEFLHPKKIIKRNSLLNYTDSASLHSGPSIHVQGPSISSVDYNSTRKSSNCNSHLFRSPSEKSNPPQASVFEHNQLQKTIPVYQNNRDSDSCGYQMSSTFSTTENSENLGDNPLDLLLQTLEAQLEIPFKQESFIQELAKLNSSAERHAAVVYLLLHNSHKMDLVAESLKKLHGFSISGGDISRRDKTFGSQTFFWTKPPKDLIRVLLHQFFISHEVESYTKGTDSGSIVIGKSLFSMTMKKLNEKPNEWKKKYLPIAFSDEDNEARLIVATEVRRILKQERNLFKKKIMKNIIVRDGNPEQQIPRLIELAKMLFEWAAPKGTSYSNKEIKEKFKDTKLRERFALLRVCASYQHFHNHEAPWPEVDDQLENLKKQNPTFRKAFYNIIFKIDNYISKKKFSEIDQEKIYPPTNLEVEQEIVGLENNSSSNFDDNSGVD